ncbi:MAG: DUF4476 domain-containing protein [Omnitrophica WOR_2 bacterium]
MKYLLTLVLFAFITFTGNAQMRNCRNAMPEGMFRQQHKSLMMQRGDRMRLELANSLVNDNCLNSEQVKSIAVLFSDDFMRLDFAKHAFDNTIDKENFYLVYDAFTNFSTVFMLHDFVRDFERHPHDYLPPSDYSSHNDNHQPPIANCEISRDQFNDMVESIKKESFDNTKLELAKNILRLNPCFYTQQVKEIVSELDFESGRLELAKYAWDYTIDRENYYKVADVFSFSSSKEELLKYIQTRQ